MLYEKMPGSPAHDLNALSPEQLELLIDTYAAQTIKVSEVKFEAIGGLCLNDSNETVVGKLVDIREANGPHSDDLSRKILAPGRRYIIRHQSRYDVPRGASFRLPRLSRGPGAHPSLPDAQGRRDRVLPQTSRFEIG